jgi:hypothetical protein
MDLSGRRYLLAEDLVAIVEWAKNHFCVYLRPICVYLRHTFHLRLSASHLRVSAFMRPIGVYLRFNLRPPAAFSGGV